MLQSDATPPKLRRLLYRSEPALSGTEAETRAAVAAILDRARAANAERGITGALLSAPGLFIQALEGPAAAVEQTFERICCDLRHRHLHLLEYVAVDNRIFPDWRMAGISANGDLSTQLPDGGALDVREAPPRSAAAIVGLMRKFLLQDVA